MRVPARAATSAALALLAGISPAARATEPLVFAADGTPLHVGSVVAVGVPYGDGCSLPATDYLVAGAASVRLSVTGDCRVVLAAVDAGRAVQSPLRAGRTWPRQPEDPAGEATARAAVPRPLAVPPGIAAASPDDVVLRRGFVSHRVVYRDGGGTLFVAADSVLFGRDVRTGAVRDGRLVHGYCGDDALIDFRQPPVGLDVRLPFRNEVVACTYKFTERSPERATLKALAWYRQSLAGVVPTADFTVHNWFTAVRDTDGVLDRGDFRYKCPLAGFAPVNTEVLCDADEWNEIPE
jgi:hypothetical protein